MAEVADKSRHHPVGSGLGQVVNLAPGCARVPRTARARQSSPTSGTSTVRQGQPLAGGGARGTDLKNARRRERQSSGSAGRFYSTAPLGDDEHEPRLAAPPTHEREEGATRRPIRPRPIWRGSPDIQNQRPRASTVGGPGKQGDHVTKAVFLDSPIMARTGRRHPRQQPCEHQGIPTPSGFKESCAICAHCRRACACLCHPGLPPPVGRESCLYGVRGTPFEAA